MNRPQRFRGLATDPGAQRKAPSTVIQRENKPKGPRLDEQLDGAGDHASSGKPADDTRRFHFCTWQRVQRENNRESF